jgi:hypothetical protein
MAHALTAYLRLNNFNSALLAHDTTVTQTFVLTADALVILYWSEYLCAEESITLRLNRTVVDRLWLGNLTK